jgi:hypothetical protein
MVSGMIKKTIGLLSLGAYAIFSNGCETSSVNSLNSKISPISPMGSFGSSKAPINPISLRTTPISPMSVKNSDYRTVEALVYESWEDKNHDGVVNKTRELVGLDKKIFSANEQIEIAGFVKGISDAKISLRLWNQQGRLVYYNGTSLNPEKSFYRKSFGPGELNSLGGYGEYTLGLCLNNNLSDVRRFILKK